MDEIDYKILEILQKTARITMKELASIIHMSTPATIERVKKLEERSIIYAYEAQIWPHAIGHEVGAMVLIAVKAKDRAQFSEFIMSHDSIVDVYELSGHFSHLLHISCVDMSEYLKTYYALYNFGDIEAYIITDLVKHGIYKRQKPAAEIRYDGRPYDSPLKTEPTLPHYQPVR